MEQNDQIKALLTQLLEEAEQAHAEYEKQLGERDPDWAAWYADFIVEHMSAAESEIDD